MARALRLCTLATTSAYSERAFLSQVKLATTKEELIRLIERVQAHLKIGLVINNSEGHVVAKPEVSDESPTIIEGKCVKLIAVDGVITGNVDAGKIAKCRDFGALPIPLVVIVHEDRTVTCFNPKGPKFEFPFVGLSPQWFSDATSPGLDNGWKPTQSLAEQLGIIQPPVAPVAPSSPRPSREDRVDRTPREIFRGDINIDPDISRMG